MIVFILAAVGVLLQWVHLIFARMERNPAFPVVRRIDYSIVAVFSGFAAALAFFVASLIVLTGPDGSVLAAAALFIACCGALLMLATSGA